MPVHFLVEQLRFARSELARCLDGISDDDARQRVMPMNCISWVVGHLADQENFLWLRLAQGKILLPELNAMVGWNQPATTPPLADMWDAWRTVTAAVDPYLDTLTPELMQTHVLWLAQPWRENIGNTLLRNIYHYWFHIGEAHAAREMLGHTGIPEFVGSMAGFAYHTEA